MKEHDAGRPVITAAHVAVAIVAACAVTGTRPERAFDNDAGQGRARVMAAAGCIARLGWDKRDAARLFQVHPNRLTPSGLGLARVDTEHLLIIADALAAQGLTGGDGPHSRFMRPYGPGTGHTVRESTAVVGPSGPPDPTRSDVGLRSSAEGPPDPTRSDVGPRSSAEGPPDPTRSGEAREQPPVHSTLAAAAAAATSRHKAGGDQAAVAAGVRAARRAQVEGRAPDPARRERARPAIATRTAAATERLKPVTDRVVRWTRQQLALGADIEFVADCFGVDVEALAARARPDVGVAA